MGILQHANYRLALYILPIPTLVSYALLLTGCVSLSPGVANLFIVKLQYSNSATSSMSEIRLGYFGICTSALDLLTCQSSTGKDPRQILTSRDALSPSPTSILNNQVDMVAFALTLQPKFLGGMLAAAGVLFAFGLLSAMALLRDLRRIAAGKPNQARRRLFLRRATLASMWLSVAFSLASATSVTQTTDTLAFTTQTEASTIKIRAGTTLKVLQWLAVASSSLFTVGISSMVRRHGGIIEAASSTTSAQKPVLPEIGPAMPSLIPGPMPGPLR